MGKTYRYDPDEFDFKPERHKITGLGYGKRKVKYKRSVRDREEQRDHKKIEQELLFKEYENE